MPKRKTHIEDCIRLIGAGHEKIHADLDKYAAQYPHYKYLEYHHRFSHTEAYINDKEKTKDWNFYEVLAAKIHIIRDYELFVLNKPFKLVKIQEIPDLWEKVKKYIPK